MKITAILLLLVGTILAGCAKPAEIYAIRFRSLAGELLAAGTIELKLPLPTQGKVTAAYHLKMEHVSSKEKDVVWFFRLFDGKKDGVLEWGVRPPPYYSEPPHSLEFMPGLADANIGAQVSLFSDGKAYGTWHYAIFEGGFFAGVVEMEKR